MKPHPHTGLVLFALIFFGVPHAFAQGSFSNLGFESATLSPVPSGQPGGEVSSLAAIPNWTAFIDNQPISQVLQNNLTAGNPSVDILGPNWSFGGIIEGQYTIVLQPGGSGTYVSAGISQTGLVPADAQSLQFKAAIFTPFSVTLGGQTLTVVPLGTGPNYTLYGATIPSSAVGQSQTLAITALAAFNSPDYFDSFVFSPQSIPEPAVWAILLCGAALTAASRRKSKR